jgi:hypothetical protein
VIIRRCILAVFFLLPLFAEGPAEQRTEVIDTQHYDFVPSGTVRWTGSYGDLYIEGWDAPKVEITVIRSTRYYEPEDKDRTAVVIPTVKVESTRKSDSEIVITTTEPDRRHRMLVEPRKTAKGVRMEYRVSLPRATHLVIDHRGGMVLAGNMTADIEVANRDGDIMLMVPAGGAYAIDARTKMGHIASDFPGSTLSRYLVGQRFLSPPASAAHRLHLRTGFGGITILALPPEGEGLSTRLPE